MYHKNRRKRMKALLCIAACSISVITGCGNGSKETAASSGTETPAMQTNEKENRPKISIMLPLYYSEAPKAGNELEQKIMDFTGVEVEFIFTPSSTYNEKVNLMITSNDVPNVIGILDPKASVYVNAAQAGMFWGLNEYMDRTEYLKNHYDEQTLKNASINGELYGLPRGRPLTRDGIIYRKDWAEKLGLEIEQPMTVDKIYEMIKAFATQDPDGNGVDDTYGVLVGVNESGMIRGDMTQMLDIAFGGGNGWLEQGGQLIPTFMTEAHKKTLNFMKRLYDEGLMNTDFATVQSSQFYELLDREKAGIYFETLTDAHERLDTVVAQVQSRDPELAELEAADAKMEIFDTIYQIQDENGELRACTQSGFNGVFAIAKTSNKTEEDLLTVLNFFDKMDSPEGQAIIEWGIEGRHFEYVDGVATQTKDSQLFSSEVQPYWQLFCTNRVVDRSAIQGNVAPMYTKVYAEMESLMPYAVYNPIVPLISDTYSINGSSLDKIIYDATTKYIMGLIDEDGWDEAVEQWRRSGGDQVIEEYTAQYFEE
ncbi:MAG: extracellular solute-binding protein [Lachnospiraceae bacterium]|nr:extracellular solute-binding protein [Lachnospiraceae bacterium]